MFEREQLRCKLLEGRVEEIKLRYRLTVAEIERRSTLAAQRTEEEVLDPDNPEEFLRIITSDLQFRDVLNSFQDQVLKVEKKRQNREYVMERTDFEIIEKPPTPYVPPPPEIEEPSEVKQPEPEQEEEDI